MHGAFSSSGEREVLKLQLLTARFSEELKNWKSAGNAESPAISSNVQVGDAGEVIDPPICIRTIRRDLADTLAARRNHTFAEFG